MKEFFVDQSKPGIVRGGFFDDMGGMLVGLNAQWVCDALNEKLKAEAETIEKETLNGTSDREPTGLVK